MRCATRTYALGRNVDSTHLIDRYIVIATFIVGPRLISPDGVHILWLDVVGKGYRDMQWSHGPSWDRVNLDFCGFFFFFKTIGDRTIL